MSKIELNEIRLIGISLGKTTSNKDGQSAIDCGNLWQKFEKGSYSEKIAGKLGEEILAVYHQYEGDHTKPFSYFIGCKVNPDAKIPEGMESLLIPGGSYEKIEARGKMPDCVANAWREIWASNISRAYHTDFEVYDERSKDWTKAEVDLFISTQ
jgi:predicted transcriptional regulator YdeE